MSEHIPINGRANKTKSAFRMEYSAGINIKAKPDRVWALMTNAADFPRWNSTVKSMEGKIGLGEVVKLIVTLAPNVLSTSRLSNSFLRRKWYGSTRKLIPCSRESAPTL